MENLVTEDWLRQYFAGKKVFITGHTGFKGAWLSAMLHYLGATLKGFALAPEYNNGLFSLLKPMDIIEDVTGDIRDGAYLQEELLRFEPDYIFHLAAQPLVRRSYMLPAETFATNVAGTANLLEAMNRLSGPCTTVVITTDKVYENREQDILYTEDDPLGGYDPYSASKACAELVVSSFRRSFFQPENIAVHHKAIASARAGNVIGGGDWNRDRIIPDIVRSLMNNQPIAVRNPLAIRPWQHVLEPLIGYLQLAACLRNNPSIFSKPFNFGPLPADHLTVRQLAETAIESWGGGSWTDISDPSQPHEAGILKLSIERAMQELRWRPKLSARQAIEWTIRWYRTSVAEQATCSMYQIKQYLSL